MIALKMRIVVAGHGKLNNDQLRAIIEADPLTTTWEVAQELNINYSMVIWHLKQIGKVKKLNKWIVSWTEAIKKIIILKCCLLLFYATTVNHFLVGLWHATKSGFYMTTGDDQLSGWTEKHENGLDAQSCPVLCNSMDFSLPGSSVHGILQARILDGLPFPSSGDLPNRGSNAGLLHCRQILYHLSTSQSQTCTKKRPWSLFGGLLPV